MDMYVKEYHLPGAELSHEAIDWLLQYDWPGNVRELQNLMERAVLLSGSQPITSTHFLLDPDAWPLFEEEATRAGDSHGPESSPGSSAAASASPPSAAAGDAASFDGAVIPLHEMECILIAKGLEQTSGNRTQAAELLGISVRTLRNKLNEYRAAGVAID
jgi:DNA-binding NtrC family response regulator